MRTAFWQRVLGWRTKEVTWLERVIGIVVALALGLSWGLMIHEALQ